MIDIDFETFSRVDITKAGAWRYAHDPSTEVLCMAYKLPGKPTALWVPGTELPDWCKSIPMIEAYGGVRAHNVSFELSVWDAVMAPKHKCVNIPVRLWHDSMAQCAYAAIPMSLGESAKVLNLPIQKDEDGRRIMLQLSQPRTPTKNNPKTRIEPSDAPDKFAALYKYCVNDVDTQMGIADSLPTLPPSEREVWELDQAINLRGIRIDRALTDKCVQLIDAYTKKYATKAKELTGGKSVAQIAELRNWIFTQGVETTSLSKASVEELLASDLPSTVREVLEIRQQLSKSSVKKINSMLSCMDMHDDRVRYAAVYHGAGTGRWAGRLIQPQNLARGVVDKSKHGFDMDEAIDMLMTKSLDELIAVFEPVGLEFMDVVSSCLRGFIVAKQDHTLIQADYSNIEGRILAWVAGEDWKITAFEAFDNGVGPDLYKLSYSAAFNTPIDAVDKQMRQVGKVMELALGYAGGVGAFRNMAKAYGVRLRPMYELIWEMASADERQAAERMFKLCIERNTAEKGKPFDDAEFADFEDFREEFLACEITKSKWRKAHPNVCKFWYDLEQAAITAILNSNTPQPVGRVSYLFDSQRKVLTCLLPSGRSLHYQHPFVKRESRLNWRGEEQIKLTLGYCGVNGVTKKWEPQKSYGGHLCENICQAIARDCLVSGMVNAEYNGYAIIMTVHDEIVTEVPIGYGSVEDFETLICKMPDWASGLPLAAEGWQANRYRK